MKTQSPTADTDSIAETPKKVPLVALLAQKRLSNVPTLPVSIATPSNYTFPDEAQQKRLMTVFFEKVHPSFPFFPLAAIPGLLGSMNDPKAPLYAIILSSLRFCGPLLVREESEAYWNHCKDHIIASCLFINDLAQLRTMALLAVDLFGRQRGLETATIVAIVAAAATRLRLHLESSFSRISFEKGPKIGSKYLISANLKPQMDTLPWSEHEARRHLFWEIFLLDRMHSLHTGAPALISDDIECLLPASIELWMAGKDSLATQHRKLDNMVLLPIYDTNCFLLEVVFIMGQVQTHIQHGLAPENGQWAVVDRQIHTWRAKLPPAYLELLDADNALFKNNFTVKDVVFHGLYHALIILAYSSRAYPGSSSTKDFQCARTRTLDLAIHLTGLAKQIPLMFSRAGEDAYALCGPYYAFSLWTGARLLLVHSYSTRTDVFPAFDFLMRLLVEIGKRWDISSRYVWVLRHFRDQIRRRRNSFQSPDGGLEDETESAPLMVDWLLDPQTLWQLCEGDGNTLLGLEMSRKRSWNEDHEKNEREVAEN